MLSLSLHNPLPRTCPSHSNCYYKWHHSSLHDHPTVTASHPLPPSPPPHKPAPDPQGYNINPSPHIPRKSALHPHGSSLTKSLRAAVHHPSHLFPSFTGFSRPKAVCLLTSFPHSFPLLNNPFSILHSTSKTITHIHLSFIPTLPPPHHPTPTPPVSPFFFPGLTRLSNILYGGGGPAPSKPDSILPNSVCFETSLALLPLSVVFSYVTFGYFLCRST